VSYVIAFIGRLLSTSLPDMAALYVGPLIVKLLAKVRVTTDHSLKRALSISG